MSHNQSHTAPSEADVIHARAVLKLAESHKGAQNNSRSGKSRTYVNSSLHPTDKEVSDTTRSVDRRGGGRRGGRGARGGSRPSAGRQSEKHQNNHPETSHTSPTKQNSQSGTRVGLKLYQSSVKPLPDNRPPDFTVAPTQLSCATIKEAYLPSLEFRPVDGHKLHGDQVSSYYDPVSTFNGIAHSKQFCAVKRGVSFNISHNFDVELVKGYLRGETSWCESTLGPPPFIFKKEYNARSILSLPHFISYLKNYLSKGYWHLALLAVNHFRFDRTPATVAAAALPECLADFLAHSFYEKKEIGGHKYFVTSFYKPVSDEDYQAANFAPFDDAALIALSNGIRGATKTSSE